MTLRDDFIANLDKQLIQANARSERLNTVDVNAIRAKYNQVKRDLESLRNSGIDVDDELNHIDRILSSAETLKE